jgi:choline dehydrogenase-like flavoprotein
MANKQGNHIYAHIVIRSGFGGSVSSMRLSEKGYDALVLEIGKPITFLKRLVTFGNSSGLRQHTNVSS